MGPATKLLRTQSDARLAALTRDGHELAFEAIVERYRRPLLRGARRILPEARAEDAVQQAFLAAWRALRRGDEIRELKPWLYRIVQHTALNALRVKGYEHEQIEEALRVSEAPQDELERRTVVRETLAGLAALPERQREALMQTALEGRSQAEVAAAMGLSEGAVRQLVHRARLAMRAGVTAVTPLPFVEWLAAASRGPVPERVAEAVAAVGAGGTATALAKAGVVAVVAGGAVTGGVALKESPPERAQAAETRGVSDREPRRPALSASVAVAPSDDDDVEESAGRAREADRGRPERRRDDDDDHSGHRGGDDDDRDDRSGPREGDDDDRAGHRGGDDDRSGDRNGEDEPDDDGDRSGHSGDDVEPEEYDERSGLGGDDGPDADPSDSGGDDELHDSSGSGTDDELDELDALDDRSGSSSGSGSDDELDEPELD